MAFYGCTTHLGYEDKMILGKWKGDKTIFIFDGDTIKVNQSQIQHIFFNDSTWWGFAEAEGYETYPYVINGMELLINGQDFEIIKLDEKQLVYRTWRDSKIDVVVDSFIKVEGTDW